MKHTNCKKMGKCQANIRGYLCRRKRLPNILYSIQNFLKIQTIKFCEKTDDGRINSCMDETSVIKLLLIKYGDRIQKPDIRMWYDILVYDYTYGWIPVNIKSTTTTTSDNTGNLAMCVYAYTDELLNLNEKAHNGHMSKILIEKLKKKEYNSNPKKDYYFIVLNKIKTGDIIVNSVKGLSKLTPNINNLPFQIRWDKNRNFVYGRINKKVELLLNALKKPPPSWSETFMTEIRKI